MKASDWNARYAAATQWSLEPNAWVAETVGHLDPGTAVDLGAGEGRNALWLASLGWEVTAVDFSAVGLATGRARAEESGLDVEWVTADATTWVSPQQVDLVVIAYLQLPAEELLRAIGTGLRAELSRSWGTTARARSGDRKTPCCYTPSTSCVPRHPGSPSNGANRSSGSPRTALRSTRFWWRGPSSRRGGCAALISRPDPRRSIRR